MSWCRVISAAAVTTVLFATGGCGRRSPDPEWPGEPESPRAEIVIDLARAHDGRVPVSMRVIGAEARPYRFVFKAKQEEYGIHDVRFFDGNGHPLRHTLKKRTYVLKPFEGDVVQATWEAEPGGLARHGLQGAIREDFATFDGRLYLMPNIPARLRAARIHFTLPRGWKVATPFRREGDWYYLDTFEPNEITRLLEKSCIGAGYFEIKTRRLGDMEVRVASYAKWDDDYKEKITDSSFRILEYFHDTFDFDLRSPYLVVWSPTAEGYKVHGGSGVNGTCLQNPHGMLRPFQLLSHRVAHSMNKYHPAGMRVADPIDRWFREGWPSYMEVVATAETEVAPDESYFERLYASYNATRRANPEFDLPLAQEPKVREPATEFIHYKKGPLVTKLLADLVRTRSERTLEEFMRAMWAKYAWYEGRFDLKRELEAFTGASFDDFWEMMVFSEGTAIPAWEGYLTDRIRNGMRNQPAAHVGGEPISGNYLHYLASSGEFATFSEIREFLIAAATQRRELEARGVQLYDDEIRRHLFALPPQDRLAIARFELSCPLEGAPATQGEVRLDIDRNHHDGQAFAELLELERAYVSAISRGPLAKVELRAVDGPTKGTPRLAFGADATLLFVPQWRSSPKRIDVELTSRGDVAKHWTIRRLAPLRISPADRPASGGVVGLRVAADGSAPVTRAFWQRGFEKDRSRSGAARRPAVSDSENPEAWFKNGLALSASGRYASALESFTKALEIDPDDAKKWNKKGETLAVLNQHDEALKSFDHAFALDPRFVAAAGNRGLSLAVLDRREESLATLELLTQIDSESDTRFLWKGRILEQLGELEPAVESYRTYAELAPKRPDGWYRFGHCLLKLQRLEEAVAAYDRALELDPRDERSTRERRAALSGLKRKKALAG
jgi:Flp pilus assembly protein TadD